MPLLELVRYYLWIAPHLLLVGIAIIMLRRHMAGLFPWFFVYACVEVTEFAILFVWERFHVGAIPYLRLYSVTTIVSTVLRFGIILEIARHLASHYDVLRQVIKPLFRWTTVVLLIAALGLAVYAEGERSNHAWFVMNMLDRTALILQAGLLMSLFLFSRYLTLSWRNPALGIALGIGIYASVDLVTAAISSQAGFWHARLLDYARMATYHISVLIWMYYLLVPERAHPHHSPDLPTCHEVDAWNKELERLLHQ